MIKHNPAAPKTFRTTQKINCLMTWAMEKQSKCAPFRKNNIVVCCCYWWWCCLCLPGFCWVFQLLLWICVFCLCFPLSFAMLYWPIEVSLKSSVFFSDNLTSLRALQDGLRFWTLIFCPGVHHISFTSFAFVVELWAKLNQVPSWAILLQIPFILNCNFSKNRTDSRILSWAAP